VIQTAIAEQPTIRPHRMGIGYFNLEAGKLVRSHYLETDIDGELTSITELVGTKRPDFVLLNDNDLAYAKVRLDSHSHKVAMSNLSGIEDSLARTLVWTAAWDATRDGEASGSDFIELVLNHIGPETESTTILTLLRQLVTTGNLYVQPAKRQAALERIADGLIDLAEKAKPGSDSQLQFVKFIPGFARSASQKKWMSDLLSGEITLAGFTVDQDVRWELITGLVSNGVIGEAEIAAELERDNTANGQRFAAGARAAIPTAANKEATWKLLVETEEYSNTLVQAASMAFYRVTDLSLIEGYSKLYHEAALGIWERFSYKIAEYLLINLYPVKLASAELASATKQLIASKEVSEKPALRRILVENLADVERALAAQQAD
jgi:aminopeptidase N